ncbi:MAG: GMC family oxidoreductase [Geminicoccaceae bacterium]
MLLDLRALDDGQHFEADVCIIGGGPAGITLALELASSPLRVLLLESGGFGFEQAVQELAIGETEGDPYYDLFTSRLRRLGGTTGHWSGCCHPLLQIDLETRPAVPHSGWPITMAELAPWYPRAQELCEVGPQPFDGDHEVATGRAPLPFDPAMLGFTYFRVSPPTRFGTRYREDLERAERVRVVLHATVTGIDSDPQRRAVTGLRIGDVEGRTATATARTYVLACGGIDNARQLLLAGLGNEHDCVGRFFMEHPEPEIGWIEGDAELLIAARYGRFGRDHMQHWTNIELPAEVQRKQGLVHAVLRFTYPRTEDGKRVHVPSGAYNLAQIVEGHGTGEAFWRVAKDLRGTGKGLYRRLRDGSWPKAPVMALTLFPEQLPDPDNRVTLTDATDSFGRPQALLTWRLRSNLELKTGRELALRLGRELGRLDIGRVRLAEWMTEPEPQWPDIVFCGYHHMGTTRMAADPRKGVVDADCRVHGVENLYVAGSSVFPTSSWVNPTLTICAMSARLAAHLRSA